LKRLRHEGAPSVSQLIGTHRTHRRPRRSAVYFTEAKHHICAYHPAFAIIRSVHRHRCTRRSICERTLMALSMSRPNVTAYSGSWLITMSIRLFRVRRTASTLHHRGGVPTPCPLSAIPLLAQTLGLIDASIRKTVSWLPSFAQLYSGGMVGFKWVGKKKSYNTTL